ncbi:coniferyl aldehyde dehydrogenase, partial [Dokdonella sp.]|uniref:coniferyl aldehyde dehydrogenase n=1 Tax=Dokdonella sp. TaxID=2291710 RepID=UPI002F3E4B43
QRLDRLMRLRTAVAENEERFEAVISADFGHRSATETTIAETLFLLGEIKHAARHVKSWMAPRRIATALQFMPAKNRLLPQPLGVVGIIAPWNYPLQLTLAPAIGAIAAGNRVMIKPSELTPRFAALLREIIAAKFAPTEMIVTGVEDDIAKAFATLPFDHLVFTGSTRVGRLVAEAAGRNLTPITLELGGKSPAIVGEGARMPHAIERIVLGKLLNAGQTCIAPDYVLLPRARVQEFIDGARAAVARLYPRLAENPQYAGIASERHYARLSGLRDAAIGDGAVAHALADAPAGARVIPPTLLTGVDDRMGVMQQEIFGPLLPIVPYDSIDEAIAYVNAHPHPLALYVFDDRRAVVDRVLDATLAGGVSVNDTILHIAQHHLPFGGVGASGMGVYHGEDGFRTFSRMKPVFRQARWNLVGLLNPPYRTTFRRMLRMLLGG